MRRLIASVFAVVVVAIPTVVGADDYLSSTVDALKSHAVYVAPGTPGVTPDTAGELETSLHDGDNIYIAMLPTSAAQGDLRAFAATVSRKLSGGGTGLIFGISAGDQVIGYSNGLPPGVAVDLMSRATSVSVGTQETLNTFIRNVHNWQDEHPEAPASKPQKKKSDDSPNLLVGFLLIAIMVGAGAGAFVYLRERPNTPMKFRNSPDSLRGVLEDLLALRPKIRDLAVTNNLDKIARYTEDYFTRCANDGDAAAFSRYLNSLHSAMTRYVDIQDHSEYYDDSDALLRKGREATRDFADYVLKAIKRGGRRTAGDFAIDTDILSAQRYS